MFEIKCLKCGSKTVFDDYYNRDNQISIDTKDFGYYVDEDDNWEEYRAVIKCKCGNEYVDEY